MGEIVSAYVAPARPYMDDRLADLFDLRDASNITHWSAERSGRDSVTFQVTLTRVVDDETASTILAMDVTP